MKVLIGFECSGRMRDEFARKGHDAISCDLKPSEVGGAHYEGSIFDIIDNGFDLAIFHPPCTRLTVTGNRWYKPEYRHLYPNIVQEREDAVELFMKIANCSIPKICIENPTGIMSTRWRQPDQIIQPWYFGDSFQKSTALWLKGLPKLIHIKEPDLFNSEVTHVSPGEFHTWTDKKGRNKRQPLWYANAKKADRATIRSRTFPGFAKACADQWG